MGAECGREWKHVYVLAEVPLFIGHHYNIVNLSIPQYKTKVKKKGKKTLFFMLFTQIAGGQTVVKINYSIKGKH